MQCSFDTRGNSVPTILLLMQERLYAQDGLKVYTPNLTVSLPTYKKGAFMLPDVFL